MTNFYLGLARGPIDHQSSSVINSIANGKIDMGSAVELIALGPNSPELLARVKESDADLITDSIYGIAVGGDTDGIYGDGTASSDDSTRATAGAGQGVVVVTQGRCLARVDSANTAIAVGDPLSSSGGASGDEGLLIFGAATSQIIARALQPVTVDTGFHIIAVDVQREGQITA